MNENEPVVLKKFWFEFRCRKLPFQILFDIIDPFVKCQLFKPQYFNNEAHTLGGK